MKNPIKIKNALARSLGAKKFLIQFSWNKGFCMVGGGALTIGLWVNDAFLAVSGLLLLMVGGLTNLEFSTETASN